MKKNLSKFLTILLAMTLVLSTLTGVVFAATPEPLFIDDFETGTMDNWAWATANNTVSTWQVQTHNGSQALNMNGGSKLGILYANVSGSEKWSDYIVEYDFTPVTSISYTGMYFRCTTSANNGYFMQFVGGKLNLHEELGSSRPQIASAEYPLTLGTTYKIRIELKGESIKIYVDDDKVIDVTDDTYSQGRIALRSQGNGLYVDNITVTPNIVLEDLELVSSSIADGDEDVTVNPEVTFTFNRTLTESEAALFTISDSTNGIEYTSEDYLINISGETVTLTFKNPLQYKALHNIMLSVNDEVLYNASFITEEQYEIETLFTEDFESGTISQWAWATANNTVSTWQVQTHNGSQALNMNGGSKIGILYANVNGSEKWSDYIVEYDFTPVTAMTYSGIYFRCTTSANKGYFMQFYNGKLNLHEELGSSRPQIASAEYPLTLGTTYKIRIELKGESIKIYVDNNKVIDVTDDTYSQGRIALRSQGNGLYVDNITVTKKTVVLQDLRVITSSIEDGDTEVPVDPEIAITFNRELTDDEVVELAIKDITNDIDYTSEDYVTQINEDTLTITFPDLLAYNAQHSFKLSVNEEEIYSVSFTTEKMAISITSLAVTKADGSAIGALKDETAVKVTVNVKNTDVSENAVVYVAAYANGGYMRGIGKKEVTLSGGNTPVEVSIEDLGFKVEDTDCHLVAFVWSNDGSLTPLALTKTYTD